jgi:hypothetical protein
VLTRGAWWGIGCALLTTVIVTACGDEVPSGPPTSEPVGNGIALAVAPTYSTSLSPTTSRTGIGPIGLGTYPEPTLVEIRATGTIDRYYGFVWYYYALQGQFDRTIDAGGDYGTQYVHIAFDSPAMAWFKDTQGLPLQEEWSKVAVVQGSGRAEWVRPGTGGQCDTPTTPDCFSYSGSFDVSVTPFPAELVLEASKSAVTPGQNVTFTASVVPDTIENVGVPFKVAEWRWLPDAGGEGAVLTQCANQKLCNFAPTVSGTMRATGFANGADDVATVHVTVFPCLTGDSLLDDPLVRELLRMTGAVTGYPSQPPADRLERGGALHCTLSGECEPVLYPPGPDDDACNWWPPTTIPPGTIRPVVVHTHEFAPGDELPPEIVCRRKPGLKSLPAGVIRLAGDGPSGGDFATGAALGIILAPNTVWVIPPRPFGEDPQPGDEVPYDRLACDPLASPVT